MRDEKAVWRGLVDLEASARNHRGCLPSGKIDQPLGHFVEPVKKFWRKPLSRRIYGDRGQVFLAAADRDELGIARPQAALHNRLQRRSKNSKGRRILKDQSPEHQPFDNRELVAVFCGTESAIR